MKYSFLFLISLCLLSCGSSSDNSSELLDEDEGTGNPFPNPPSWSIEHMCFVDQEGHMANGTYTLYHDNGEVSSVTTYVNGHYTELRWYFEDGQLERYESGDSIVVIYFENGQKEDVGRWKNGEHHGIDTVWYSNGQIRELKKWGMGELHWVKKWNEEGELIESVEY